MEQLPTMEKESFRLHVSHSVEDELNRIKYTLEKLAWFEQQGYILTFPKNFDKNKTYSEEELSSVVEKDFENEKYVTRAHEILSEFEKLSSSFFDKATAFGLRLQPEYNLALTRYGVGGSYGLPNNMQVNFEYPQYSKLENIMHTVFHEIIHLSIEEWIQEYHIEHWTKERLVDLTYNKLFSDKQVTVQHGPDNPQHVQETFERLFPDMKGIIMELGTMK
jgi:hypothetical protein